MRVDAASWANGRDSGVGVGGPETAAASTSISMEASVSTTGKEPGTIVASERLLKILFTAMIPAAPVSALKSAPT